MLIAFSCKNFGSFRDQIVFSMEATSIKEYKEFNTFTTQHGTYLKSSFIFGANASGKSNLFRAINFMKNMVNLSVFDDRLAGSNDHFQFLDNADKSPTAFEMVFQVEGIVWTYGFELLKGKVTSEWLVKKNKRSSKVFERTEASWKSINLFGEWKKYDNLREHTRDNALFLSLAAMLNVNPAIRIRNWFGDLLVYAHDDALSPGETIELIEENPDSKQDILLFLKKADFGIDDFDIKIEELDLPDDEKQRVLESDQFPIRAEKTNMKVNVRRRKVELKTRHKIYDIEQHETGTVLLPFLKYQSTGTIKMFQLLGPILNTLSKGGVLIIDEIDSRLHPLLVRYIVSLFHSLDRNAKNGQLICNTHDALLLDEAIRRDQVWFMKKNSIGASELYSLSDFHQIRKNDLILKKYLLGIFGAIPFQGENYVEVKTEDA